MPDLSQFARSLAALALCLLALHAAPASANPPPAPSDAPAAAAPAMLYDPANYPQRREQCGVTIRAMAGVSTEALDIAELRVAALLAHLPVVQANLARAEAELRILRAATPANITGGLTSYAQEANILKRADDPFADHRDILLHETCHMLHLWGFGRAQCEAISARYAAAKAEGLWPECYAMTNDREFFAELAMWYFGTRGDYGALPAPQAGPDWLRDYDPQSYALLDGLFSGRIASEHLAHNCLEPLGIAHEGALVAQDSQLPCQIGFYNGSGERLEYHWLDYAGRRVKYGEVAPGDLAGMDTFAGHPWLLCRMDGTAVAIFLPRAGHNVARITAAAR